MTTSQILDRAREQRRRVLTEIEAKQILAEAGIHCTSTRLASNRSEAVAISEEIGYPVVLKVSSVDITHKSDCGGVKVNLVDRTAVEKAHDDIMAACRKAAPDAVIEGVSVQPMAREGTEVIVGMTKDANFGPVIMIGLGGVFVEILKDVAFRIVPLEQRDADEMISEIKGKRLLEGYRGQEPVDLARLKNMLLRLSDFVHATPGIEEIDMNPVIAYHDDAVVVDARIILSARD